MAKRWSDLDAVMRRVCGLRVAADDARATLADRAAIETAITQAAQSLDDMIETPEEQKALAAARSALMIVEQMIAQAVKPKAG